MNKGIPVSLSRDSFGRFEIVRRIVKTTISTCSWCGSNWRNRLFEYGTLPDDNLTGRVHWHEGLFCSKLCHDIYHS